MESNSTSPLQVHLGAKLGRGSVWTAYDATLQLPDGSRITGLVWKERVPAYVPTKHWKAAKEHAIETELRMVNGPLAPLLGRTVPEVYGVWTSPGGFAHAVLMENAGPMVTAEEIEDPLVR